MGFAPDQETGVGTAVGRDDKDAAPLALGTECDTAPIG